MRRSVEALKGLQVQQDDLTNKFKWELQELEKKVRWCAIARGRRR